MFHLISSEFVSVQHQNKLKEAELQRFYRELQANQLGWGQHIYRRLRMVSQRLKGQGRPKSAEAHFPVR